MKGFNWRWLVVAATPTVSILHVRWLCYVANQPWPNDGATVLTFAASFVAVCMGALWAATRGKW
jgi:hypothetical protein